VEEKDDVLPRLLTRILNVYHGGSFITVKEATKFMADESAAYNGLVKRSLAMSNEIPNRDLNSLFLIGIES